MASNKFLDGIDIASVITKTAGAEAPQLGPQSLQKEASAQEVFGQLCKVADDGARAAVVDWARQHPELAPIAIGQLMLHLSPNA